jgi:exodeoxyribonuclease VII small subunit
MAKATSIEDHFRAIETAVSALEAGDLPLEEALTRYESGLKAVRAAKAQLDRYAARLTELRAADDVPPPAERG